MSAIVIQRLYILIFFKSRSIPGDLINKIRFPGVFQEIKKITVFFKEFQGPGNDFAIFPGFQGIPGGVRTLMYNLYNRPLFTHILSDRNIFLSCLYQRDNKQTLALIAHAHAR